MSSVMLIDARHAEETRVGVISNNRLDEFDYESANKIQIKGNVYLAKITRVEPSLQAAFVEYGGNRQGFLAFSEIHPDYYQIPIEDREAILAEEEAQFSKEKAEEEKKQNEQNKKAEEDETKITNKDVEVDDIIDETLLNKRRIRALKRRYKIQEVIKKRQILLVQIVKEERGNKGAAVTTYLSLPGRYCVLMPNTTHGNGISRKISDAKERQRLRKILESFTVPPGMGCIIRTAGMNRTKAEVKRDLDYLFKTWEEIREATLKSVAPKLIFEEGSLIKRSLRDLYDKHIKEVLVEGDAGFELAKDFMKRLIPSHAKKVKKYSEKVPLFNKYGVEDKIDSLFASTITLPSGGYIVFNPTEALVAIDVNSGKATKEHNIEETALKTNIEAAEEIARQLRLRDIAGLIVIDFIDMEEMRNIKTIERKFKEALKADRARIFTNRISSLGLLEMSRQRLRSSLYEISTQPCPNCDGSGRVPSMGTLALRVLRAIEDQAIGGKTSHIIVHAPQELVLFLLNAKRHVLDEVETKFNVTVLVNPTLRIRMPHFDVRGMHENQIERELQHDTAMFAPGLIENITREEMPTPVGFGKSDGRSNFAGQKRRRGRRGGSRQRHGRGYKSHHVNQQDAHHGEKPQNQSLAKPEDKIQKSVKTESQEKIEQKSATKKPKAKKSAVKKSTSKAPTKKPAAKKPATKSTVKERITKLDKKLMPEKVATSKQTVKSAAVSVEKKPAVVKKPEEKKKNARKGWWQKAANR